MKYLLSTLALFLVLNSPVHAGKMKEIYTLVQEEIEYYYQTSGTWSLLSVSNMEILPTEADSFIIVSAESTVRNNETGVGAQETCLVTLSLESLDAHSVNCF